MKGFCLKKNRKIPMGKIKNWCVVVKCVHLIALSSNNGNNGNNIIRTAIFIITADLIATVV